MRPSEIYNSFSRLNFHELVYGLACPLTFFTTQSKPLIIFPVTYLASSLFFAHYLFDYSIILSSELLLLAVLIFNYFCCLIRKDSQMLLYYIRSQLPLLTCFLLQVTKLIWMPKQIMLSLNKLFFRTHHWISIFLFFLLP